MSEEATLSPEGSSPRTSRMSTFFNFRNRIRSRLMSGGVRFKSMMKWRRASGAKEMETLTMNNLMSGSNNLNEPVSITNELPQQAHETELINQNNETSESHPEIQENKSNLTYSVNEENFISNPFDPGTSSFSTVGSTPSYVTAEDTEITSFTEIANPINDSIVNNELNPVHDDETLSIPSTLMEVQLNAVGLAARILDVVPILYIDNGSLNSSSNTRSTRTEESFASNSGSEDSAVSSNSGIIEIVSGREDSHRRFEDDYVRPYYDLTVRPVIRKQFHQLDDDPPIY
ncbi:PREDICTED: uncharacterized protein LOC105364879 [Ceratosolen solmsi marchali]|uniref:Uncharacterized protein LOC105364879 n=1 Tax=Ceratosolen solmsi marchali TaxID=326594 RepID=A0AAJ7DYM6_9HYME|nr:PREDICTED: uncharacterized protein LOC105364879 [Ceratosolen solmsi marchali]